MHRITRRDTLKAMAAAIAAPALARPAAAALAPLPPLPALPATDAVLLRPGQAGFDQYQISYNKRAVVVPKLRALCKTPTGVATMVKWSRDNNLPFALRCGGHSYEGLSNVKDGVAIDTRMMKAVDNPDTTAKTITVGGGAALGDIYKKIAPLGLGFPGGSCPTVGVTGHALGGGHGYLARRFGLACDSLEWAEVVDAKGNIVQADRQQNADLLWALRGGGGGSFGVVTRMRFKIYSVGGIVRTSARWALNAAQAAKVVEAWQAWAPHAPATITSVMGISRASPGTVSLGIFCQSTGSAAEATAELAKLTNGLAPAQKSIVSGTYWEAVNKAAGGQSGWNYLTILQKAKSDYVRTPMSATGIATLLNEILKSPPCGAILDAYGGAVSGVANDATAFGHRDMLYSIQYFINWNTTAGGVTATARLKDLYDKMRPFVSGAAYVNYCDTDLKQDYPAAYWGANLPRLKQIKAAVDPDNVFRHAQSVPLA